MSNNCPTGCSTSAQLQLTGPLLNNYDDQPYLGMSFNCNSYPGSTNDNGLWYRCTVTSPKGSVDCTGIKGPEGGYTCTNYNDPTTGTCGTEYVETNTSQQVPPLTIPDYCIYENNKSNCSIQ